MFKATWSFGLEGAEGALAVRREVFVKERGIAEEQEFDWFDGIAAHLFVCEEDGTPIAAGRMYPDEGVIRLGNIAVMPNYRSQPFYDLALRTMLFKAQQLPLSTIAVRVEQEEKAIYPPFGFTAAGETTYRGRPCTELTLPRDGVIWDSPCKHM